MDRYCAGHLSEGLVSVLEKHMAECPRCSVALFDDDADFDLLLSQPWYAEMPSPGFHSKIMRRVHSNALHSPTVLMLIPLWVFYVTLWSALGLWFFAGERVAALLQPVVALIRTAVVILRTGVEVMNLIHFNEAGLMMVFAFALVVFAGIGLISKEVRHE
jgi:hypothetical protein